MATSRSFGQFAKRMRLRAKGIGQNSEAIVRKAALAADQSAVLSTPVDTGRARANWITSIGQDSTQVTEDTDPLGASALAQGQRTIAGWRLGHPAILISNGVPYIMELENGSSAQAPNGMAQQAATAARRIIGRDKLLKLGSKINEHPGRR